MKFELDTWNHNVSDDDLIQDIKDVANKIGRNTVTISEYEEFGKYHPTTLQRRFRSWFIVLEKAGLEMSRSPLIISDEDLFENIKNVWINLERQPKYKEIRKPLSKYSAGVYENRFGTWRKALELFIEYMDVDNQDNNEIEKDLIVEIQTPQEHHKKTKQTKRDISERLRFKILLRDGFRCQSCGRSPLKSPGVELHVDHIIPWSIGGETVPENLQTKCKECNLGKGNAFDK